jgi:succinylglutamic semialdehyde dehydrogenase
MATTVCQGHLIGNQWVPAAGPQFESISPTDDSVVWSGGSAPGAQVRLATDAARQACGPWWDCPLEQRIELVNRFAEAVRQQGDELAELISQETGKPLWESRLEVAAVLGKVAVSVEALHERRSEQSFALGELRAVTRYMPFGVMAVLGPFNLPAHLPNGHIVPAILAGNTVVLKPSEQTPAVGQWMVERWLDAGVPAGVINLVQGPRETAIDLASDDNLDGLLFTGSSVAGRALHRTFGQWPQKMLALEMSGNNPLIVHKVDDLRAAAYHTIQSAFITAGQRCTCARRLILIQGREGDQLLEQVLEMLPCVRIGYWNDESEPFAATVISKAQGMRLLEAQEALIAAGARPICRSQSLRDNPALLSPGIVDVTPLQNRSDEELFGPILQVVRVPDFDAAIVEANHSAYGMSASLLCDDEVLYRRFIHQIRAGVVNWNRPTTGGTGKLPFGGCGLSGNNRPSGYFAIDYCNWPVASLESDQLSIPESLSTGIELS